jgi:hypothetical protein
LYHWRADLSAVARLVRASFGETRRSLGEGGKVGTTNGKWADYGRTKVLRYRCYSSLRYRCYSSLRYRCYSSLRYRCYSSLRYCC